MATIFAEATPPGRGGVSILRISGPQARASGEALAGSLPDARQAYFRVLREADEVLDQALVLRFDAGASFTGEDVVEFQLHGAPVVVRRVKLALQRLGLRQADAGEFTRRAFLNGRIDLAEVEGLGDLLAAETEAQRRQAMRAVSQELQRRVEAWRGSLIEAGSLIAVSLDFADEDVPQEVSERVPALMADVREQILELLADFRATERLREGYEVALIGPVNAGKSSLLNRLAQRDIAIISDIAGTTRDVIELAADIDGLPVTFLDTAGLRDSEDLVEREGISRAEQRAEKADLRLHLSPEGKVQAGLWQDGDLQVWTKADLDTGNGLAVSAATGAGIADLLAAIRSVLEQRLPKTGLIAHERQADALRLAADALDVSGDEEPEILADQLWQANRALEKLLGRIDVEDYLGHIFANFCIGK
ncbi:MAG: tRNA uridine-5-carboxymethylaminomethyl(34) synthesis GTPase MnmE [Paracoccus sp. (in: a-proteobacteria)]|uniref:tRNA uridine-5-carboxymethylaminomethyl(34) synthesis GTPase MnmE n=1 Tax=Paracoccus sp. TaxID=267 RepID=UPI0026DFBBEC|nr:tRNA uridine-5-carboxymethylaminomethyl(34) synthesis GTPase MnmE [Paracoccus sp. (in: a-proteobacteria)]MDO5621644.1 tRNA uridine-5-carboxymethylaminomethyl(34) synthesis GTPase MnmE [Paracoccus sp. (in: a-proteobacteria)]